MQTAPASLAARHTDSAAPVSRRRAWRLVLWAALLAYVIALIAIAVWPTQVDVPARGMLADITRALPWLTYARIEFAANVLLFVPFGVLVTLLLPRARWWYALAAALLFSTTAEALQLLIDERTSTAQDVAANIAGAIVGILAVAVARPRRRQGRPIP